MHPMPDPQRRLARIRGRARANSEKIVSAAVRNYLTGKPVAPASASGPAVGADEKADRRRCSRVKTSSAVLLRRIGGFNFNLALEDISAGGCRVEMLDPSEVGDPVVARLPQLEPLGSRICWTKGATAGVEFLTRIHPAVFDMLVSRLSNGEASEAIA